MQIYAIIAVYANKYYVILAYLNNYTYFCGEFIRLTSYKEMTKEELLGKLKEKLGRTNLSERTLSDYAEKVASTMGDDSELSESFIDAHVGVLKSIQGQLSSDIASGIEEWKKTHSEKDPKEKEPLDKNDDFKTLLDSFEELKAQNKSLSEKIEKMEKGKVVSEYRKQLYKALKAKGATNDYILKQTFGKKEFDTSKSVEDVVEESLREYDANYSACFGDGYIPREPNEFDGNGKNTALDEFFSKKAAMGKFPSSEK